MSSTYKSTKGYIDAIEARLRSSEALLNVLITSKDERARSLIEELAKVDHH